MEKSIKNLVGMYFDDISYSGKTLQQFMGS